jgi:hypothetical protein
VASVWRGVDATTPFDTNFFWPACQEQQPMSIDTALTNDTVLSVFRTNATGAGTGFTLLGAVGSLCNAQYAPFTTAQTGLAVGISGGGASTNAMIVDVLHGTSGAPTLVGSAITINTTANKVNFTVPSAAADDYIVLLVTPSDSFGQISGIGLIGTPLANTAVGVSPVVLIQNTICCNYNPGFTGGNNLAWMEYYGAPPSTNVTQTTNLYASPWNGSTFGSPSFGTVFADSNQTHYNYALAGGSPALNAASNPGSSPYGQSLIPVYQSSYTGTVTPGTPIPPKTPRSDIGPALTGAIGALKGS